jgi:hypothetical protein
MTFQEKRAQFEKEKKIYESTVLNFHGVDGYDVYNCSIPFNWQGESYIFGRVERRNEWARSLVRLFKQTDKDDYTLIENSMIYQLEDPFISIINNEIVMGGTHVRNIHGVLDTFYSYFYKGTDLNDLFYFATGPDRMKDIRLIQLQDGKIGVFSRPRGKEIEKKYNSGSIVGFTVIDDLLTQLDANIIENAPIVHGLFDKGEWGGCNQCYFLDTGNIGVISHKCYEEIDKDGIAQQVYTNVSFVVDPKTNTTIDEKIIATRTCYPDAPAKKPNLKDCVFTSGIVAINDGKVYLYSGLGDTSEGRVIIDNPFLGFGNIVR